MTTTKLIAIPAIALAASLGLAACGAVNGYYSGGLPGHLAPSGECVPDGANGDA
jgi:hypothetical protein